MSEQDAQEKPGSVLQMSGASLERAYIEEFLRGRGQTLQSLHALPEGEAKQLLVEASVYASGRLAEVETRARFVQDIHDSGSSLE